MCRRLWIIRDDRAEPGAARCVCMLCCEMFWCYQTTKSGIRCIVLDWGSVLGRNRIKQIRLRGNFLVRMKSVAYSNLTSQRIMFPKNSINSTHQHITKYIIQQLQAWRSSLRSNLKVWRNRKKKKKSMINEGRNTEKQARTHEILYGSTAAMPAMPSVISR